MVKTLLSAMLVVTQVLSWSASPLFLCMSADGTVCVDFGPGGCDCCRHEAVENACSSGHESCHDHGHSAADESDPCGCEHIQISVPQAATLARSVAAPDSPHHVIPPTALPSDPASGCCLSATGGLAHASLWGRDAPSTPLVLSAPVVMQC